MKKILAGFLLFACFSIGSCIAPAGYARFQRAASAEPQIPYLSELFGRYEEFNRLYTSKRRAGANVSAIEPIRRRGEEAFRRGSIPGILEALAEAQTVLAGKKWDERQKFIASLTLETDRLVIEPNQTMQVSLTRMLPSAMDKAFSAAPTVTFALVASGGTKSGGGQSTSGAEQPMFISERLTIAETSTNSSRKLLLPEGAYQLMALIEAGGAKIAEIKRPVYAVSDFSDTLAQMSRTIAGLKASSNPKVKAIAATLFTPEFQVQRLAQLNKTRGEVEINPVQEIDRIEAELSAIAKGQDPFAAQRAEVERAYQASDGKLVPYRLYVPKSYDGASPRPVVVLLHGALGDERYYFSGLFDPSVIEGEAERRGYILVGVNGRGRFGNYSGPSQEDAFEVISAVARDYNVDPSRVYLAGHSMGGLGAWLVAAAKPDRFAAIAAVSGGPPANGDALAALLGKLKGTPALIAHGAQDGIVPVQLSRGMAAAAEKAGLKVTYLEVADGDHLSVVASTFPAVLDFFDKNSRPK